MQHAQTVLNSANWQSLPGYTDVGI